jgi:hypothetical protein
MQRLCVKERDCVRKVVVVSVGLTSVSTQRAQAEMHALAQSTHNVTFMFVLFVMICQCAGSARQGCHRAAAGGQEGTEAA